MCISLGFKQMSSVASSWEVIRMLFRTSLCCLSPAPSIAEYCSRELPVFLADFVRVLEDSVVNMRFTVCRFASLMMSQGEHMMNDAPLTADERRTLRMWFRQAIAKLELEEVTQAMLKEYPVEPEAPAQRSYQARRRAARGRVGSQNKQLV